MLGTGFALRLARNLAADWGGRLQVEADRLTLRLPVAQATEVGQAATRSSDGRHAAQSSPFR